MKAIKHFLILAAVALLAACATPLGAPAAAPPTPAQIAAQVCPPVETALAGLNALDGLPIGAQVDLKVATPVVDGVCAAGATVTTDNLAQLNAAALPTFVSIIKGLDIPDEQRNALVVNITAAQIVLAAIFGAQTSAGSATQSVQAVSVPTPKPTP